FVVLASKPDHAKAKDGPVITTFVFRVRNVPAALYKALGGFATNGVNMTKLESYQLEGSFNATMFYADIEGHPDERPVKLAMEELHFFSSEVIVLGTYPASPFRAELTLQDRLLDQTLRWLGGEQLAPSARGDWVLNHLARRRRDELNAARALLPIFWVVLIFGGLVREFLLREQILRDGACGNDGSGDHRHDL